MNDLILSLAFFIILHAMLAIVIRRHGRKSDQVKIDTYLDFTEFTNKEIAQGLDKYFFIEDENLSSEFIRIGVGFYNEAIFRLYNTDIITVDELDGFYTLISIIEEIK